ncbi:hypothetical protein D3C80_1443800 [compost metagenome]
MIKHRVGWKIFNIRASDSDLYDARVTRIFIKRSDQTVTVVACLDGKPKVSRYGFVLIGNQKRCVFQIFVELGVNERHVHGCAVANRVGDLEFGFV